MIGEAVCVCEDVDILTEIQVLSQRNEAPSVTFCASTDARAEGASPGEGSGRPDSSVSSETETEDGAELSSEKETEEGAELSSWEQDLTVSLRVRPCEGENRSPHLPGLENELTSWLVINAQPVGLFPSVLLCGI